MRNSTYIVRNYRPSDFDNYVKLNVEAKRLESTGRRSSPGVISENLGRPNYLPEQDLFVVESAEEIVGFMNITPELSSQRVIIDCLVHPEYRQRGLADELLGHAIRRAKELKAKAVRVDIREDNIAAKSVLLRLGFTAACRFLELRLPLASAHLPDVTPNIYSRRHLQPGEEDKLTQLQNRSFAGNWEYNPNTTEDIIYYTNLNHRSPEDVNLIYDKDKPIGYCWTNINYETEAANEGKGRILMLGVEPDYRGRRIGRIALLTGLAHLKNKGVRVVELTVASENKIARALYRSVGFKTWTSSLYYEKALD